MDDLFRESGSFVHGILHEGRYHKTFTLEEEVMRHTLEVSNDITLDILRLLGDEKKGIPEDEAYYSSCLLAKRLKVEGIEQVTPEMVERLSRMDGRILLSLSATLDQRRDLFRAETEAAAKGHAGADEAGFPPGGNPGDEPAAGS